MATKTELNDSDQLLNAAQEWLGEGKLNEALSASNGVLELEPENVDALYLKAVCLRLLEQFSDALNVLGSLKAAWPGYGRAYQEEGLLHVEMGNGDAAVIAFEAAVLRNPSLTESWRHLASLLQRAQQPEKAALAGDALKRLEALPRELVSVRSMIAENRLAKAENLCRWFMQRNPQHVEGMRLLADLGVKTGVLDDAEFLLESALEFEPDNDFARFDYMNVLYRRQDYVGALEQSEILLAKAPDNLDFKVAYANQCVAVGRYDPALKIYEEVIPLAPERADLHLVYGHALKTIGKIDEAINAYRNCYEVLPSFGDAYWSLANLKTYRFDDGEVAAMQAQLANEHLSLEDRAHFCFALGKHCEDAGDFANAFAHYDHGNACRNEQLQYAPELMTRRLEAQARHCTKELFDAKQGAGHMVPDPIFIVGLPRAGSTLLEQVLASHSQIEGTFELPNISALAFQLGGRRRKDQEPLYPANLAELSAEQIAAFGKKFIDDTKVHRTGAPFFIDKMPNNFRHIGLIKLILPNARIIDARREPMACCFSGFKQLFASGQEFTYGLENIGRYYRDYVALMDHWDAALPGQILRVQYEDVVADTEGQVRRILEYLDLPFEQACVDFHTTERSIRTPSAEQVRQPIYRSGLEQWKNFEAWLGPLKSALKDLAPTHN